MKSFDRKNPYNETEKLIIDLLNKLCLHTNKFVEKNSSLDTFDLLTILQAASINYICSVTKTCSQYSNDKSNQLDHINRIKDSLNRIFEMIKVDLKSVNLN